MIVQRISYSYIFEVKCFLLCCCWNFVLTFSLSMGRGMLIPKPGTLFSIEKKCKVTEKQVDLHYESAYIPLQEVHNPQYQYPYVKLLKSRCRFCVCEHVHAQMNMKQQTDRLIFHQPAFSQDQSCEGNIKHFLLPPNQKG